MGWYPVCPRNQKLIQKSRALQDNAIIAKSTRLLHVTPGTVARSADHHTLARKSKESVSG